MNMHNFTYMGKGQGVGLAYVGSKLHVLLWHLYISSTCHQFGGIAIIHSHLNLDID